MNRKERRARKAVPRKYDVVQYANELLPRLDMRYVTRPFRILWVDDGLPAPLADRAAWLGNRSCFTAANLDWLVQPLLEERGQWAGPCDVFIMREPELFYHAIDFLNVVIHEAAHQFEFAADGCLRSTVDTPADPLALKRWGEQQAELEAAYVPGQVMPWTGHGKIFIRASLTLAWRARRFVGVPLSGLCCGRRYGITHARHYERALGTELMDRKDESLEAILRSPAPPEFVRLFASDRRAYATIQLQRLDEQLFYARRLVKKYPRSVQAMENVGRLECARAVHIARFDLDDVSILPRALGLVAWRPMQ